MLLLACSMYCFVSAVSCGDPGRPLHSVRFGSSFTFQSSLSFTCSLGFNIAGQKEIICLANGHWSSTVPLCRPVQCSPIHLPQYARANTTNTTYTAAVGISCYVGFLLRGVSTVTCQSDTQWSSTVPKCVPVQCPSLVPPSNTYFLSINTSYLGLAVQSCLKLYSHKAGSVSRLCQSNGQWSGQSMVCIGKESVSHNTCYGARAF